MNVFDLSLINEVTIFVYGLVTPDIWRDWARIKELAKTNDNEQAERAMLRTLKRLGSRVEVV